MPTIMVFHENFLISGKNDLKKHVSMYSMHTIDMLDNS